MKEVIKKIISKIEDYEISFLEPNVKSLKFWGLLLPKKKWMKCFYIIVHLNMFLFTITEFVDIWLVKSDLDLLLTNMKTSMLSAVSCTKVATFLIWQKDWKAIIDYATKADKKSRSKKDPKENVVIFGYTKYCHVLSYLYWYLTYLTVVAVILQPITKYVLSSEYRDSVRNGTQPLMQVVNSWVPFDKTTISGYLLASAYQAFASIYAGGWITSFDTIAIVIMVFFCGELELLKMHCTKIYETSVPREVLKKIKECHQRHLDLVKYSNLFNSCLSPIMFIYVVVSSIMLCASVFQLNMATEAMQTFLNAEYLLFGVSQLFIYCWHGNNVTHMSGNLINGIYDSDWWKYDVHRRELILLTGQFDRAVVLTAGPFINLTLAAFVSILKGSYSYYALISNSRL